jgi:hypothetical protein
MFLEEKNTDLFAGFHGVILMDFMPRKNILVEATCNAAPFVSTVMQI